jgi:RING finger protein 170
MGHGQDEICKTVAEQGGLDTVLQFLDQAIQTGNKVVAKSACALLSQVFSHAL